MRKKWYLSCIFDPNDPFGGLMEEENLVRKVAQLESYNDQLVSELKYIDNLLMQIGFPEGIETLKIAATELKELQSKDLPPDSPDFGDL